MMTSDGYEQRTSGMKRKRIYAGALKDPRNMLVSYASDRSPPICPLRVSHCDITKCPFFIHILTSTPPPAKRYGILAESRCHNLDPAVGV